MIPTLRMFLPTALTALRYPLLSESHHIDEQVGDLIGLIDDYSMVCMTLSN